MSTEAKTVRQSPMAEKQGRHSRPPLSATLPVLLAGMLWIALSAGSPGSPAVSWQVDTGG